jgi:hypothetical protein
LTPVKAQGGLAVIERQDGMTELDLTQSVDTDRRSLELTGLRCVKACGQPLRDARRLWQNGCICAAQPQRERPMASSFSASVLLTAAMVAVLPAMAQSRGELLYQTHCIACHSTQVHWREQRLAADWESLRAQVQRWQAVASLDWREDDVNAVARYLNDRYYGFDVPASAPLAGDLRPDK